MRKYNVLAISGSTRKESSNLNFIHAISALAADLFNVEVYNELVTIPHFNPDFDNDQPPEGVLRFRAKLKAADAVLICTPEYAMGVPGTLKNAIDWTVSSMEFSGKPTALITASSSGQKGHIALLETLKVIECKMSEDSQLLVSFVKTKISNTGTITDQKTKQEVILLIDSFYKLCSAESSAKE